MKRIKNALMAIGLIGISLIGCKTAEEKPGKQTGGVEAQKPPTFVLAISEYPSWSAFLAAAEMGLIDAEAGEMGDIERRYNVDVELKLTDYDTCLTMAGTGKADAVALTNMDALIPASSIPSVVILPTSTSNGADALIVPKTVTKVSDLRGKKVHMLAKSVSEYMFRRNLEKMGEDPAQYEVVNMDPQAAATAYQQRRAGVDAIVVWNPFVLDTLESRTDSHALISSTGIPNEIIDAIVAAESSLAKPGGDRFAQAVVHTFYALNKALNAPASHVPTLMAIGAKFSNITDPKKMEAIVTQTKFFGTSAQGIAVVESASLGTTMQTVNRVYRTLGVIDADVKVTVGTTATGAGLRFDASYMKAVAAQSGL